MTETKTKVKAVHYKIEFTCECGGKMERVFNNMLFSNNWGTHYPHKCTKCEKTMNFVNEQYPRIETEYV